MKQWMLQAYLNRDRINFALGAIEALFGALGMYLAYQYISTDAFKGVDWQTWTLVWWAFLVGAWLVITGGLTATKGWNDPDVEKERQEFAAAQKQQK
jgi:hypothetical protein